VQAIFCCQTWACETRRLPTLVNSSDIVIDKCTFLRLDGNAVFLAGRTRNVTIRRSVFEWLGENAIVLWGHTKGYDATSGNQPLHTVIADNRKGLRWIMVGTTGRCLAYEEEYMTCLRVARLFWAVVPSHQAGNANAWWIRSPLTGCPLVQCVWTKHCDILPEQEWSNVYILWHILWGSWTCCSEQQVHRSAHGLANYPVREMPTATGSTAQQLLLHLEWQTDCRWSFSYWWLIVDGRVSMANGRWSTVSSPVR
jgi:hypothetical protein